MNTDENNVYFDGNANFIQPSWDLSNESKKMTPIKKSTVHDTWTYKLTNEINYVKKFVNSVEKERELIYKGPKLYKYELKPLYNKDLSILKSHNPCWGNSQDESIGYDWLKNSNLPEPEDIDISKIIYLQFASHSFFNLDKSPIPVVINGDYIEAHLNDYFYDIKKLKEHLSNHSNIIECSDILNVPYYNEGGSSGYQYLSVLVYPTVEILEKAYELKQSPKDLIFYKPYHPDSIDFLNIKQFAIRTTYD